MKLRKLRFTEVVQGHAIWGVIEMEEKVVLLATMRKLLRMECIGSGELQNRPFKAVLICNTYKCLIKVFFLRPFKCTTEPARK